ncbi:unnamed protein product [Porites evermanni]|uniref:CREG-like beta-barrel domain-containing protein n=1 Tax=Porites evermanni TaxID=104178 RepID=A0ABN8SSR9_9CNID|nr:unnamed protein product [Porites evermanni]
MDFYKDKAKLIDKLLEEGPTSTEEKDEALVTLKRERHTHSKFFACHVVVLVLVLVLGMCLFARVAYYGFRTTEYDQQSLSGGLFILILGHSIYSFHADVLRGSSRVPAPRTSAESKDKFLSHCSQISAGDHMQIIGDSIGTVEVKVLTSQTHTYKLRRTKLICGKSKAIVWRNLCTGTAQKISFLQFIMFPEQPFYRNYLTLDSRTNTLIHVGPDEIKFAQNALFSRHPVMKSWPKFHDWQTLKLEIVNVWMQDIYGPADIIPVKDYLKVKL